MSHAEYKIKIHNNKTKKEIRERTNQIIDDLSLFGRSVRPTARSNIGFSKRLGRVTNAGIITFASNLNERKSVIVLDPNYEISRTGKHFIRIRRR